MKNFILALVITAMSPLSIGAEMDARLNMAIRLLDDIDTGLQSLQAGDVGTYNTLSKKLTKAADMLKKTETSQHPDFVPATQHWNELRQIMVDTAERWNSSAQQNAQSAQGNASNPVTEDKAATYPIDANDILQKYQRDALPQLTNDATQEEFNHWAASLSALRGSELAADVAVLDSGNVNPRDAERVKRWITGDFQRQLTATIKQHVEQSSGVVRDAQLLATQILDIPADDAMRGFNFAHGENGLNNQQRLIDGLRSTEQLSLLAKWFPDAVDSSVTEFTGLIDHARDPFELMMAEAVKTAETLAAMPKKERPKRPDFLKPIEQEIWLNGRYIGSLSTKGTVYIESSDVGSITSDGRIWVRGNDIGSIEPNGEVWLNGRQLGSLEDNGEVWRQGTQIGLVDVGADGAIWIGGSKDGALVPFDGEWKRAAIVYFFRDIFG